MVPKLVISMILDVADNIVSPICWTIYCKPSMDRQEEQHPTPHKEKCQAVAHVHTPSVQKPIGVGFVAR